MLYPFHLRNLLIQLGVDHVVSPRWTDAVQDEWIESLAANGRALRPRLLRTRDIMNRVLPEADVRGYEHHIASLRLPDAGDCHVLAGAVAAGASILLTFNLKHFPAATLAPFGLALRDPDSLLCELHDRDAKTIEAVVEAARKNLSRTEPPWKEFVRTLERQGLMAFARRLAGRAPDG